MLRKVLLVLMVLALSMAAVSPAFADEKPGNGKSNAKGKALGQAQGQVTTANVPLKGKAFQGAISAKSGETWTVTTPAHGDVSVSVTGARVKWPGNKAAALNDFQVGDRVAIQLENRPSSGTPTARMIHFIPGKSISHFEGTVTALGGGNIKVTSQSGEEQTFAIGANVQVLEGKQAKAVGDLKVGDAVTVVVRNATNSVTSIKIRGADDEDKSKEKEKDKD